MFSWPYDASDNGINCSETCQEKPQQIISQSLWVSKLIDIKKICIASDYCDDSKRVSSQEIFLC